MRTSLDAAVLTSEEIGEGFGGWANHDDPLPPWDMGEADID